MALYHIGFMVFQKILHEGLASLQKNKIDKVDANFLEI